ncbi:DNA polymerase III subunit beta [Sphaerothrix gracilis]|uniref:DNA polymerase III subunit beta n=1 Tax=Sphaerothrix gracilis TaxID=3151835 RepID=UPI0031FDB4D0
MKFVCSQSELNTHLSLVSRAVPSRPSKPILGNVLLKADAETQQVALTGFDESLGIQTCFAAQVERSGRLTLPAKLLGDIVSRLPNEDLVLEETEAETVITLTCASGHYQVRGLSADEYPNLPEVEAGQATELSPEVLLEGLRGALFAASTDETKQVLTGVHLLSETAALEFAATDGHRLAVVQTTEPPVEKAVEETAIEVTVPGKALRELERVLQMHQGSEAIALRFDPTQVIFELGQQRITTRLLEGQYPNYRQLIPRQFSRQMTVDRKLFVLALERIAVLADQKNNIVKLSLDNEEQAIALTVEAQEVGSGRENVAAQITGDSIDIAFNVRYLLDGLKVLNTSEVQLQCNSATSPAVLSPLGGSKMTYLVMPVQIRG